MNERQPERQPHEAAAGSNSVTVSEIAELLDELARVEHEIEALERYREQLRQRLGERKP